MLIRSIRLAEGERLSGVERVAGLEAGEAETGESDSTGPGDEFSTV